jgi:hypothetical protein
VAANREIPVNLKDLLYNHHYVTLSVLTMVIIMILIGATIGAVVIRLMIADNCATRQTLNYQHQALGIMQETVLNRELNRKRTKSDRGSSTHLCPHQPHHQHHKQQHTGLHMYHRRTQLPHQQGDQDTR